MKPALAGKSSGKPPEALPLDGAGLIDSCASRSLVRYPVLVEADIVDPVSVSSRRQISASTTASARLKAFPDAARRLEETGVSPFGDHLGQPEPEALDRGVEAVRRNSNT
jgi:hypothetical protein